jgi:hypothetical protein
MRLAFSALLLFTTGCAHQEINRKPAHESATPVYSLSRFNWVDVDYATLMRNAEPPPFRVGAKLEDKDLLVTRLQKWADLIHAAAAADYSAQNGGLPFTVPKPKINVMPAKTAQAWSAGIPVCFKIPTRVATSSEGAGKIRGVLHLEADSYYERVPNFVNRTPVSCVESKADIGEFVAWFNSFNGNCKLFVEGGELVIRGEGCAKKFGEDIGEASGIEYYAVSNLIFFTSQMIAISEAEAGAVATLAHELGHYYRTHTIQTLLGQRYEYWYQQENPPRAGQPLKLASSAEYTATLKRLLPYPMPIVERRKFAYVLRDFLVNRMKGPLKEICGEACSCNEALKMVNEPWTYDFLGITYSVPKESQKKYLAFEDELLKCSRDLEITNRDAWLDAYKDTFAEKFIREFPSSNNLFSILETLNEKAMEVDREYRDFELNLIHGRIGYYTSEQEADDFSTEYVSKIGLDPLTANLEKYRQYRASPDYSEDEFLARNGGLTFERCLALRESGWSHVVPMGSLTDIHHGGCYRLFNMDQEVRAHGWSAANVKPPQFKESWSQVLQRAKAVTPRVSPTEPMMLPEPSTLRQPQPTGLIIN